MRLSIRKPDDMHVHLREGAMMFNVVPHTASQFARALVMPNTDPPILTGSDADSYAARIRARVPEFEPLKVIKLVRSTTPEIVSEARSRGVVAAKFYPEGVTTNSDDGCRSLSEVRSALEAMEEYGMVLCLHGETPGEFCMDRERDFLHRELLPIARAHPRLKIVLEHVTTESAVGFVSAMPNVAATVTIHHLVLTLDDVVGGMLRPHNFCKPIAKTPQDRRTLRATVASGNPKFFLGTDSAPHHRGRKECGSGCAGVFTAPVAMQLLAQVFDELDALDQLEAFCSEFGASFYGLPLNEGKLELVREPFRVPAQCGDVIPFMAQETLSWSVVP